MRWWRGGVWAARDFRLYWAGHTASQAGSAVTQVALPLVALLALDASSTQVGVLRAAEFLPYLLLTLPAGIVVDRCRRRPLMLGADLARAGLLVLVPLAALLGGLSFPLVAAVAFGTGVATVLFDVSYLSVLPGLVGRDGLQQANSALEVSRAGAGVAGPGAGGLLVGAVGAPAALLVDAGSFLASAGCLRAMRVAEAEPERRPGESVLASLPVGFRQVWHSPVLRPMTGLLSVINLVGEAYSTVFTVFVIRELGLSAAVLGLTYSVLSVGYLLGTPLSPRLARRVGIGPTIMVAVVLQAVGCTVAALAPRSGPLPLLLTGIFGFGVAVALFNLQSVTLRQSVTPGAVLGRVNAVVRLVGFGTVGIGAVVGGVLGDVIGLREVLLGTAALMLACVAIPLLSAVRTTRLLPAEEPVWQGGAMAAQTWEYATIPLLIHNTKAILDTWGADGWELVQVLPGPGGGGEQLVAYLKRPKP